MKKSWLSDNIRSILAIIITMSYVVAVFIILLANVAATPVEKTALIGALTNVEFVVLGYFFTASKDKPGTNVGNVESVEIKSEGK